MHLRRLPVRRVFRRDFSCISRLCTLPEVKENDVVLLKRSSSTRPIAVLTEPLRYGQKVKIDKRVFMPTDDILGKHVRDSVTARGLHYRILQPSLAEYTDLSPRIVTPIYSQDATLIVSLLDLHPAKPSESMAKLEIFEAGTGHGALTLHLARAIHGANGPLPDDETLHEAWRANRRAKINTLDISKKHSDHAQITVKNFRNGIYFPNVDFQVGTIEEYVNGRLRETPEPFFDHAILDLPETERYVEIVGKALKPNGILITFCPSITQVNACLRLIKNKSLPFCLEKVVEVGSASGVGGREWDVRFVKPRAKENIERGRESLQRNFERDVQGDSNEEFGSSGVDDSSELSAEDSSDSDAQAGSTDGMEMVCRPKVGIRIAGGGFIGVWRRIMYE